MTPLVPPPWAALDPESRGALPPGSTGLAALLASGSVGLAALLALPLLFGHPLLPVPGDPSSAEAYAQASPCEGEAYEAFDFWVGTWEVRRPDGQVAGTNTIRKVMGGCVLHESYDGARGYHGESFNIYDHRRGVWHQTWVDRTGLLLVIEGGPRDGSMVLEGEVAEEDGPVLNRITWTPLPAEAGGRDRVRQHWQVSSDGGESWETIFDGLYLRREG